MTVVNFVKFLATKKSGNSFVASVVITKWITSFAFTVESLKHGNE